MIFCRGSNLAILSMTTQLKNRIDPENTFGKPPMTYILAYLPESNERKKLTKN